MTDTDPRENGIDPEQQAGSRAPRLAVLGAALALLAIWFFSNTRFFTGTPDGPIRLVVGTAFTLMILFRRHGPPTYSRRDRALRDRRNITRSAILAGAPGLLLYLVGTIFRVNQFAWIGMIAVLFACLVWSLPPQRVPNIVPALLVFYWVHPLPGQLLGPLQLFMQRLSVEGAEWLCHFFNMRVWADELILRTGQRVFEVPEACSGMRTATVVLLCCLGSGVFFGFRWFHILLFGIFGLAQTLFLNVIRITTMVAVASGKPRDWSSSYLHDSAGGFLLGAIILIQIEAFLFERWRQRPKPDHPGTFQDWLNIPRFIWRHQFGRRVPAAPLSALFILIALLVLVPLTVTRSRPAHRLAMIHDVMTSLENSDPAAAEKVWMEIDRRLPRRRRNDTGHILDHARILIAQLRYDDALEVLDRVPPSRQDAEHALARTWALIGSGRTEDAQALIEELPPVHRRHPGIAIVAAEFAMGQDDTGEVIFHARRALLAPMLVHRVRDLFPYLASRGRWSAIYELHDMSAFRSEANLMLALTAALIDNNFDRAEAMLHANRRLWFGEPLILPHLLSLAMHRPLGQWRDEFASSFFDCLPRLTPAQLCASFEDLFMARRPDLAWLAYRRIEELDADHPALYGIPVRFARDWFVFRKLDLGIVTGDPLAVIDVTSVTNLPEEADITLPPLTSVPMAAEVKQLHLGEAGPGLVGTCISKLEETARQGELPYALKTLYADMLEVAGRIDDTHDLLDKMRDAHPERKTELLVRRIRLYDRQQRWQEAYEALRTLKMETPLPALAADRAMINTLMRLGLGLYALDVAVESAKVFPNSMRTRALLAAIWEAHGYEEEALFVLRQRSSEPNTVIARLLGKTGRLEEARRIRRILGMEDMKLGPGQQVLLPPAELTVMKPATPSVERRRRPDVEELAARVETDASPFIRELDRFTMEWYGSGNRQSLVLPARWEPIGRDPRETAVAGHKVAMLAMTDGLHDAALDTVVRSTELMPLSPILWRIRIALTEGAEDVVSKARAACPQDPEIWLAYLVTGIRDSREGFDPVREIARTREDDIFSSGTFVRAADFLLRNELPRAAAMAARHAVKDETDYLPAYVVALNCAMALRDADWAVNMALKAENLAPDPWPFRKIVARLKIVKGLRDPDLIRRLTLLRDRFPDEFEWGMHLGAVHFGRDDVQAAGKVFYGLLERQWEMMDAGPLLLAADYALGNERYDECIHILTNAWTRFPDNVNVLNNLVLALAASGTRIDEARRLLPELLSMSDIASVHDTAATVARRSGDIERAANCLDEALARVTKDEPRHWREIHLNAAEFHYERGNHERSWEILDELRGGAKHDFPSDARAASLFRKLRAEGQPPEPTE